MLLRNYKYTQGNIKILLESETSYLTDYFSRFLIENNKVTFVTPQDVILAVSPVFMAVKFYLMSAQELEAVKSREMSKEELDILEDVSYFKFRFI